MARPRSKNPKSAHIGIATTPQLKERFNALNLKGDRAIEVLLYYLEKDNKKLQIDKIMVINRIKEIDKEVEELEFEKLKLETQLQQLNEQLGLSSDGKSVDVEKAVNRILERFNSQNMFNIIEFLGLNQEFVKQQAFLCGLEANELEDIVFERS